LRQRYEKILRQAKYFRIFSPEEAKRSISSFEFVYAPKHGGWLNMAEYRITQSYRFMYFVFICANPCNLRHLRAFHPVAEI
jgi:hypothetical protein